jgi:ABC-type Fe3+/spermidine/putrescine transport system ATPase subunit
MADALGVCATMERDGFSLDVDLRLPVGVTIIAGPSGAGKSTLLRLVAGLVRAARGRIALGDEVWHADGERVPSHRRGVAYVPQSLALFPHQTVLQNVMFGIVGARADRERRALEMLERMRVVGLAMRRPSTLSGGEAQRVALARAFATSPRVVLLDEPLSALDRGLRADLVTQLAIFARELAVPFVHVTHDRREAEALGDRALWIEHGRVVRAGPLADAWPDEPMPARLRAVKARP